MVSPAENAVVRASDQTLFVWQSVSGASQYVLTVASDAQLTQPVAGYPMVVSGLSASVTLPAGTLYWTVTSDVTRRATAATGRRLGVLSDTVFVRCDAKADCSAAALELGTQDYPYASIGRGITGAQVAGVANVAVAARPDGSAYAEAIKVIDGVSVSGAFDASFAPSSTQTPIAAPGVALIVAVRAATVIRGFAFSSAAQDASTSIVVSIIDSGAGFELHDSAIASATMVSPVVVIQDGADDLGPLFDNVTISADYASATPIANLDTVSVNNAAVRFSGVNLRATTINSVNIFTGVNATGGHLGITGSMLMVSGGVQEVDVVKASDTAVDISGSHFEAAISAAAAAVNEGSVAALVLSGGTTPMTITTSDFIARHGGTLYGVTTSAAPELRITSSFAYVDAGSAGYPLYLAGGEPLVVTNNTLVTGSLVELARALTIESQPAVIVNNLILAADPGCSDVASSPCVAGVREDSGIGFAAALFDNVFAGYDATETNGPCGYLSSGGCIDATLNTPRTVNGNVLVTGGNRLINVVDLDVSATFVPLAGGPLAGAGHDPNADDCFATNPDASATPQRASAPSCGPVTVDRNGVQRPNPPAIGAYEP